MKNRVNNDRVKIAGRQKRDIILLGQSVAAATTTTTVFADRPSFVEIPCGQQKFYGGNKKKKTPFGDRVRRYYSPTAFVMAIAGRTIDGNPDDDDDAVWEAKYVGLSRRGQRPVGSRPDKTRTGRWKFVGRIVGDYSGITVVAYNNNNIPAGREKRLGGDHTSPSLPTVGYPGVSPSPSLAVNSAPLGHVWRRVRVIVERSHCPPLLITPSSRFPSLSSTVRVFVSLLWSMNDFFVLIVFHFVCHYRFSASTCDSSANPKWIYCQKKGSCF